MSKKKERTQFTVFSRRELGPNLRFFMTDCAHNTAKRILFPVLMQFSNKSFTVDSFSDKFSDEVLSLFIENEALKKHINPPQCVNLIRGMVSPYYAELICRQLCEEELKRVEEIKKINSISETEKK